MQRVLFLVCLALLCLPGTASAGWLPGTPFSISDTNDPAGNSISATSTIGSTDLIDGGLMTVTTTLIAGAGGSQWIDIDLEATSGQLVGNLSGNGNWSVAYDGLASTPSVFTDVFVYFTNNEVPFTNLTNWSGFVARTDPLNPSQEALGFSGFAPFGPFTDTNWSIFVNPFSAISQAGVTPPANVNGFHFDIQASPPTPEPSSFILFGMALTGLGVARWRKRKQAA